MISLIFLWSSKLFLVFDIQIIHWVPKKTKSTDSIFAAYIFSTIAQLDWGTDFMQWVRDLCCVLALFLVLLNKFLSCTVSVVISISYLYKCRAHFELCFFLYLFKLATTFTTHPQKKKNQPTLSNPLLIFLTQNQNFIWNWATTLTHHCINPFIFIAAADRGRSLEATDSPP